MRNLACLILLTSACGSRVYQYYGHLRRTGDAGTGDDGTGSTCNDRLRNGTETDVDCGGDCPPCDDGRMCMDGTDCKSANCTGFRCQAQAACTDRIKNGTETDIDCGGTCPACADGKVC